MKKIVVQKSARRGANSVEYIILVGVVALGALAAFREYGSALDKKSRGQTTEVNGIQTS